MLVDSAVLVVLGKSCLVRSLGVGVIPFLFIEKSDFQECVDLPLLAERARHYRTLEVVDGLLNLVGLCEDRTKLVEHLRLLVEVGRHLENRDDGRNSVVIRLKLFVEYSDTVPELGILDVFK